MAKNGNCETLIIFNIYMCTFKGEEGGQKKCMFCTLVKMMIIMDDPLSMNLLFFRQWRGVRVGLWRGLWKGHRRRRGATAVPDKETELCRGGWRDVPQRCSHR